MKSYGIKTTPAAIVQNRFFSLSIFTSIFSLFWASFFDFNFNFVVFLECLLYSISIFIFGGILWYLLLNIEYFWVDQRQFIYSLFKNNEIIIWILDSFMAPETIFFEFWDLPEYFESKVFICRIGIYFLASICYKLTLFLMVIFFVGLYISAFHHFLKYFSHPYRNSFPFETLPYSMQQRFFELQTPSIRYRFTKVYPKMLKCYSNLFVDILIVAHQLNVKSKVFEISTSIESEYHTSKNNANGTSSIQLQIEQNQLDALMGRRANLSVLGCLRTEELSAAEIRDIFLRIDLSNLQALIILDSSMDYKDLMEIKKLKLKSIFLWLNNDGMEYLQKAKQILEATVNIPDLEFCYKDGIIKEKDNFEIFLVEWVLTNGYFKSFICQGHLEEHGQTTALIHTINVFVLYGIMN